jgi:7 transmembrane sweet-taste receptor of 3 GCPR
MVALPQHETLHPESGCNIFPAHCSQPFMDSRKQRQKKMKRSRTSQGRWNRAGLWTVCYLGLASSSLESSRDWGVGATSSTTTNNPRYRRHLRKLPYDSFKRDLQQQQQPPQQPPPQQSPTRPPKDPKPNNNNKGSKPPNQGSKPPISPKDRNDAIQALLTKTGYNTAFGSEPLCWESPNFTRQESFSTDGSDWNTSQILDFDMAFPNPLVDDFAFLPGNEELLPSCFANSYLTIEEPKEALQGERLRTFHVYNYQVNVTLDFSSIIRSGKYGDAILTRTPNISQVAVQVLHCVLGKSGVCVPFLHEQAYIAAYLEQQQKPNASIPGTIHGRTHIHSDFITIDIPRNQTFLSRSLTLPAEVHVEGDYFVVAALQFYTGDSQTNTPYYRWDMANAMPPHMRVVSYQHEVEVKEVTEQILLFSYILISLASAVILFLIYQTFKHRKEQVLQLSQGEFLLVFLFAALTATVCTFLMEPKSNLYCNLGSTFVLLAVHLMFAITAGRLWRINAVISPLLVAHMRQKTKWTNRFVNAIYALSSSITWQNKESRDIRRSVPKWQLGVVVGMFVSPQVILQISELIWQPQARVIDYSESESIGRAMCGMGSDSMGTSILLYCFLALLVLIGVVLVAAYSSRKLPSLFNETQVIYDSTFITVILMLLGAGIIALTDQPTTSPDVEYMVWVVVTLSITLNASLKIMLPKLKMIWKGEQVIVSKLVSDHHRKQRERKRRDEPDVMRNVTGLDDQQYNNLNESFLNHSFGSVMNHARRATAMPTDQGYTMDDSHSDSHPDLSNSYASSRTRTANLYEPTVSTGDLTTKMSNMDDKCGSNMDDKCGEGQQQMHSDGKVQGVEKEKEQRGLSPQSCELVENEAKSPKDVAPSKEGSMQFEELLTWKRATPTKDQESEAGAPTTPGGNEQPASQNDAAPESDNDTVNSNRHGRRRRRWSPLRKSHSEGEKELQGKRSSDPRNLVMSDHSTARQGRRRRGWSPLRKKNDKADESSGAKKMPDAIQRDSDADTVASRSRNRRKWSPRAKGAPHADSTTRSQDGKGRPALQKRRSIFNLNQLAEWIGKTEHEHATGGSDENAASSGGRGRRQSALIVSNRKKSPIRGLRRDMSAPRLSAPRLHAASTSVRASTQRRPRQPERLKVAPDETPARRLVLKMIDLQEQLTAVNRKIISGLVVSPEEWDLLTTLNEKLYKTFEHDVDFSWRETTEEPLKQPLLGNHSSHSNTNNSSHSKRTSPPTIPSHKSCHLRFQYVLILEVHLPRQKGESQF